MTIKELRSLTGLSQKEFADKYHLSIRQVQAWEQGWRKPIPFIPWALEVIIKEVKR